MVHGPELVADDAGVVARVQGHEVLHLEVKLAEADFANLSSQVFTILMEKKEVITLKTTQDIYIYFFEGLYFKKKLYLKN